VNLREFVSELEKRGLLIKIRKPVDTKYEVATLMRMLDGKPLLFENVKGYSMPIAANLCSSRELVAMGLGVRKEELIRKLAEAIDNPKKPETVEASGYRELDTDLSKLPILTHYPTRNSA